MPLEDLRRFRHVIQPAVVGGRLEGVATKIAELPVVLVGERMDQPTDLTLRSEGGADLPDVDRNTLVLSTRLAATVCDAEEDSAPRRTRLS